METIAPGHIPLNSNLSVVGVGGNTHTARLLYERTEVQVDDHIYSYSLARTSERSFSLLLNDSSFQIYLTGIIEDNGIKSLHLSINGNPIVVTVEDHRSQIWKNLANSQPAAAQTFEVKAPMPGRVIRVEVNEGDKVISGAGIFVLEAMKMENEIKSPTTGLIESVRVKAGQSVEKGEILLSVKVNSD